MNKSIDNYERFTFNKEALKGNFQFCAAMGSIMA